MRAIYEPKGAAREYAPLAANLYRGCTHHCRYCYAPACLRISPVEFREASARPGVVKAIQRQAPRFAGKGPVLLCFLCDPYQPLERTEHITRDAIIALHGAGCGVRILTKNPALALERDKDVLLAAGADVGISLCWAREDSRVLWEPHAGLISERWAILGWAHQHPQLRTWISIEPVIDPEQALDVIRSAADWVDYIAIGKLNHMPAVERQVNWANFLRRALEILDGNSCGYMIKDALWAYATPDRFPRSRAARKARRPV